MNKLERGPIPSKTFSRVIRYIFDDADMVEEDYMDHDECRVTLVAELREEDLQDFFNYLMRAGHDLGPLHGTPMESLIGNWVMDTTRSNSNGLHWDEVSEICKCHEVTETITVTKWKPVSDAESAQKESVPAQPASQK